jgi:predicted regulator of Ras-like GTPase activity (Roadblock/LC7/MglB family)
MEVNAMSASETLKELTGIDGFAGAAVYTPTGEPLVMLAGESQHLKEIGVLANNVLLNAQKASIEMGTGRGQQVHVEAERAHIFVRCLNEGTDPLKSQPGKAHIHLVLVLKNDSSIGLAKLRVNSVIERLAEDFRA